MKKKLLAFCMVMAMSCGLMACGGGEEGSGDGDGNDLITVGFSQVGAESDWRTANTVSMKNTFTKENGYELIFDDAQQKQENQIKAVRNFIQQEVDYIVIAPVTETGWETVLQEAKEADIPVIIVDRMVAVDDESLYTAWVGSDFRAEGDKAVAWMEEFFKDADKVNIIDLQGTIGASAQIGRTDGLKAGVEKNSNWTLLAAQTGDFTQAKGLEVMESLLKQHEDIDVVYCENDNMAYGAIDDIKSAGKTVGVGENDIKVISFDAGKAALELVLAKEICLNVECNPLHGPRVAEIIQMLEEGKSPEKKEYVNEEIFKYDTITQEIIDKRAY